MGFQQADGGANCIFDLNSEFVMVNNGFHVVHGLLSGRIDLQPRLAGTVGSVEGAI